MTVAAGFPWEKQFRFPIRNGLNAHNNKISNQAKHKCSGLFKTNHDLEKFYFQIFYMVFFGKHTDKVSTGHVLQQCFPTSILMNTNIKKHLFHNSNDTCSQFDIQQLPPPPPPPHPLKIIVQMYVQFTQNMLKHNFPTDSMSNLHQLNNK